MNENWFYKLTAFFGITSISQSELQLSHGQCCPQILLAVCMIWKAYTTRANECVYYIPLGSKLILHCIHGKICGDLILFEYI